MGYRTTLIINNDNLELLQADPRIGTRLLTAILGYNINPTHGNLGPLGCVVEQAHADTVKLVILGKNGSFDMEELAVNPYNPKNLPIEVALLKSAADKLGYYLTKKPASTITVGTIEGDEGC